MKSVDPMLEHGVWALVWRGSVCPARWNLDSRVTKDVSWFEGPRRMEFVPPLHFQFKTPFQLLGVS